MNKSEFEMRCALLSEPTLRAWRFLLQSRIQLIQAGRKGQQFLDAPTGLRYTPAYGLTMRRVTYVQMSEEPHEDEARIQRPANATMNEVWRQPLSMLQMIKDARQHEPDQQVVGQTLAAMALVGSMPTPAQIEILKTQRYGEALGDHLGTGTPLAFRAASLNRRPHRSWLYLTVGHKGRDVCNIQISPEALDLIVQAI